MNDHGALAAPLSVGIEQPMRDVGPFIDLNGGEGKVTARRRMRRSSSYYRGDD
jgi:hypothetical protein